MAKPSYQELNPPQRLLLGAGPSNIDPRVLRAMMAPILGHLDPDFIRIMGETQEMLRVAFRTTNPMTIPVSGTGTAGMEASLVNLLEPGDTVIVGINGYFGTRMAEMAARHGAKVIVLEAEWGDIIDPQQIEDALKSNGRVKLVALVHGETSTGILQPLTEISRIAHEHGALILADAVTSLGGCEVAVDEWELDAAYGATQKCLGCPPGLAPLTMGPRAVEAIHQRTTKSYNFYLDLSLLENYWGGGRVYHHTAPITMIYALHEALRALFEEGLEERIERHRRCSEALQVGLEAMGLTLYAREEYRLAPLTTVRVPDGIDDLRVRHALAYQYGIDIGGGVGKMAGQLWRIGLMGQNATPNSVFACLSALEAILRCEGLELSPGAGIAAAGRALNLGADHE